MNEYIGSEDEKFTLDVQISHPKGKIVLLDGSLIEAFPHQTITEDGGKLSLKDVGESVYFRTKWDMSEEKKKALSDERKRLEQIFYENAFFLWSKTERILSDSRMFLAPLAVSNSVVGSGILLNDLTLGMYIEWWNNFIEARELNNDGTTELFWRLGGVPFRPNLQHCFAVNEQGVSRIVHLTYFNDAWRSLAKINHRYKECKKWYDAYSLEEVLDILHSELDSPEYYEQFMLKAQVKGLRLKIRQLQKQHERAYEYLNEEKLSMQSKYLKLRVSLEYDRAKKFLEDYNAKAKIYCEKIVEQEQRCKMAKAHKNEYTAKEFQKEYMGAKRQKRLLARELGDFEYAGVKEIFPDGEISLSVIERYVDEITNERNNEKA